MTTSCTRPTPSLFRHLKTLSIASLALYGGFIIRKGGLFVVAMMMTRFVGVAEFGVYCVALVILEFAARLAIFGSDVLIVRAISRQDSEANELLRNVLGWRCLAATVIYIVLVAVAARFGPSSLLGGIVAIMGLGMVLQVLGDVYISIAQGRERVDLGGYVQMLCSIVGISLMLTAIFCGLGLAGVAIAYAIRSLLYFICGLALSHYLHSPVSPAFQFRVIKATLRQGAPIAVNRLLAVLYLGAGLLVLERVWGANAAGAYAGAMKIFESCAALGMLTAVAAFPTVSRLREESKDDLRGVLTALVGLIAWVGLPLSVLVALNADALLGLMFGRDLLGQGGILVILMCAVPLSLVYVLAERLAYAADDQHWVVIVRTVGTVTTIGILLATVSRWGGRAAAAALFFGELSMVLMFLPKWAGYSLGVPLWRTVRPGMVSAFSALAVALFIHNGEGLAQSVVFLSLFLLAAALCLTWKRQRACVGVRSSGDAEEIS